MTTPRGADLLHDPRRNKSTAFSEQEREALGLLGLLPEGIDDLETQLRRALAQLDGKTTDLERYIYLSQLQDTDETLFYRVLMSDPARFLPIVYTPTVGEACQKFGHIIRRPRGLYLSIRRRGRVREILGNWPERDVRCIVVTSGERILGLGDLGANGMGIPIGKLALYTAVGGVPPQFTLPVLIDAGTNNEALLTDPLYLGIKQIRASDEELDAFVDEFVSAVQAEFPHALIQFEDWAGNDAIRHLERYRDRVCCFNDDIQGTAFTESERDAFELHGLLPPRVALLDEQVSRRLQALRGFSTDLERYAFLRELQDTNETVFYALLTRNIEELLPIGLPRPPAPWSPSPRMRSPSVTTITSVLSNSGLARICRIEPRRGRLRNSPRGLRNSRLNERQPAPTVGV